MKRGIAFFIVALCASAEYAQAKESVSVDGNWNRHCRKCHGVDGDPTKVGIRLGLTGNIFDIAGDMSTELIIDSITNGKNKMPKYKNKLTPEDISALAEYIEHTALIGKIRQKKKQIDAALKQIKTDYSDLPECGSIIR